MIAFGGHGCPFDPITALAAVACRTDRIGLEVDVDVDGTHPYSFARRLASLDHLSGGRSAWKPVSREGGPRGSRRISEFVSAVTALWDSWEDGAHLYDKEGGLYVDVTKVHPVRHAGAMFRVEGPLDIPRPPQGRPVLIRTGEEDGEAELADVLEIPASVDAAPRRPGGSPPWMKVVARLGTEEASDPLSWLESGLVDGLVRSAEATVTGVASAGRGLPLRQASPAEGTLRDALGLPRPASRFAPARSDALTWA